MTEWAIVSLPTSSLRKISTRPGVAAVARMTTSVGIALLIRIAARLGVTSLVWAFATFVILIASWRFSATVRGMAPKDVGIPIMLKSISFVTTTIFSARPSFPRSA